MPQRLYEAIANAKAGFNALRSRQVTLQSQIANRTIKRLFARVYRPFRAGGVERLVVA